MLSNLIIYLPKLSFKLLGKSRLQSVGPHGLHSSTVKLKPGSGWMKYNPRGFSIPEDKDVAEGTLKWIGI